MKILIINGYSKNSQGMKSFADFQFNIQRIFSQQKILLDTETEFYIRDKDNLDDFLYELDNSYVIKQSGKLFDYIDMIFITGDPFQLPWMKSSRKVQVLIRMCIKTNKILFGCSFAMMSYIYLCATNFEHDINVVNGEQKGGMIGDLRSMNKDFTDLLNKDYFLDNASGDLYQYSQGTDEWVAQANIGLHYHKTACKFMNLGKFNIQTPIFKGISKPLSEKNFISRINEDICYIKKVYIKHWLVNGLDMSFIIPQRNTWFQHNVQFVNRNKSYTIIADNDKGGVIFESKNSVLIQFEILSKYPQTLVPLENFIKNKLKQIKSTNKNCDSSIIDYYQNLKNVQMSNLTKDIKKAKQRHMDFKLFNTMSQKNQVNDDLHQNNVFHSKFKIQKKDKQVNNDSDNMEDLNLKVGNRKGCNLIEIEKKYPIMDKREVVEQLHPNIFKQKQSYQYNEKLNTQQNDNVNLDRMMPSQNDYNQNLAQYTKKIFVPGHLSDNIRQRNVQSQGSIIRIRDLKSQSTNGVKKSYQEFTKQRMKKFDQIAKVVQLEQEEYGSGVYMSQEEILKQIQKVSSLSLFRIIGTNVTRSIR